MIAAVLGASRDPAMERRIGFACAFAILFVWTGFILASRAGARGVLTPWDLAALRFGVALVVLLPLVLRGVLKDIPPRRILVMGATAGLGFALFAYNAFALAPAAHGAVLLPGALPFVTAVLAWAWLGETPTLRRALSLAVVAAGIALLAGSEFFATPGAWRGDVLFFIATSSYAVFIVLVQRWRVTAIQATAAVAVGAAPFYLPVWWLALPSAIAEAAWQEVVFQGVYQGLVAMVLASLLYTRALVALGSTTVSLFTAVVPALAALAAWPVLDEPLGLGALVGVLLVTLGMALGVRRGRVDVPLARP